MYKIESIAHKDGTERIDGRYPLRKGCKGDIYHLKAGDCMYFEYVTDNKGNDKTGYLRTSLVEKIEESDDVIVVYTLNSVYKFIRI